MGRFAVVTIQHLLAPSETQSEFGFVGVVLDAELLRLLAHDWISLCSPVGSSPSI
jgi:hypothetical protein